MAERPLTEAEVLAALARVQDPERLRDVVALGMVRNVTIRGGEVAFELLLPAPGYRHAAQIAEACRVAVAALPGVRSVQVRPAAAQAGPSPPGTQAPLLPGVRHVIAVGSGKGGVGKSTVAANLAAALVLDGASVGLLDADVYGPSIPTMMGGVTARAEPTGQGKIRPLSRHGLKLMSIGFLMENLTTPVMWRGPMISGAVRQMLSDVEWGALDYLVVDLPPGTGDVPLTLGQVVPLTGVVIVMTSQDVALTIAVKALHFFQRLNVPIIGIVENMGAFICPHCGTSTPIFSRGGGRQRAEELGVPFLGAVPLDPAIAEHGDQGVPTVMAAPESAQAAAFRAIARAVADAVEGLDGEEPVIQVRTSS
jgi:ATP-binding protein involved in chromosome partitioning